MRILLFWELNNEFNTHTHTSKILSSIDFELDAQTLRFSLVFIVTGTNTHV